MSLPVANRKGHIFYRIHTGLPDDSARKCLADMADLKHTGHTSLSVHPEAPPPGPARFCRRPPHTDIADKKLQPSFLRSFSPRARWGHPFAGSDATSPFVYG